jgi:hypothetical protein
MKNSIKFIEESNEKMVLLDEVDNIIKLYASKEKDSTIKEPLEQIKSSFKETMYKIIRSGIKSIDFDKLSKEGKDLMVDFISTLESQDKKILMEQLDNILKNYAEKRRGNEVEGNFDNLKKEFRLCVSKLIQKGITNFNFESFPPFASELFDKYTEYGYSVSQADNSVKEFKSLKELKDSKIDDKDYKFHIAMKEAEKRIGNFTCFKQWWKGRAAESKPIETFVVTTDLGIDLYLDKNTLSESIPATFYIKPSKDIAISLTEGIHYIKPGSELNITSMPSWIKKISEGKIAITESTELEKIIEFSGDELNGIFICKRETESSDFWAINKKT